MYESILPLVEVKDYLRIDADFEDDDAQIRRMIASALQYIEKQTNHYFLEQEKTYFGGDSRTVQIFDYPIVASSIPIDLTPLYGAGYVKFAYVDSVTLSVGYASRTEVPAGLIEAALQMIKVWYFEAEKQANTTLLPESVKEIINTYRRFIAV